MGLCNGESARKLHHSTRGEAECLNYCNVDKRVQDRVSKPASPSDGKQPASSSDGKQLVVNRDAGAASGGGFVTVAVCMHTRNVTSEADPRYGARW